MEQSNSEKNPKFLALLMTNDFFYCLLNFDSRADILTKYNFNEARCFFLTFSIDFMT